MSVSYKIKYVRVVAEILQSRQSVMRILIQALTAKGTSHD